MLQTHRNCLNTFYLKGIDQTLTPKEVPVMPQSTLFDPSKYKEETRTDEEIVQ
jgi:hypothetical protein